MFALGFVYSLCLFVGPLLVVEIIPYIDSQETDYLKVFFIIFVLIITKFISTILQVHINVRLQILATKMITAIDSALFEKVLKFSLLRTTEYSPGDLVNLLIVDTLKIFDAIERIDGLSSGPPVLLLSIFFMYEQIGASFIGGFIMFIIMSYVGFTLTNDINQKKNRVKKK